MTLQLIKNKLEIVRGFYSFATHGGTTGVKTLDSAILPVGAFVMGAAIAVETAVLSGGAATMSLGHTGATGAYVGDTAKATLAAAARIGGMLTAGVQVTSGNLQNVVTEIKTADVTAGEFEYFLFVFMPMGDARTL